ncbi:MAG: methyltransferase domain-containing protein [Balneolaceae bacterium]|nr:methyltransferase domain-containing protein [Balneolaceae bacterium]
MEPRLQRRVQRYGWDKAAKYYDNSWKAQLKPAQDKLLEMADLKPGEMVLETSCGTGLVTFRAAEAVNPGGEVMATDLSDQMIQLAQQRQEKRGADNVIFKQMDAEDLDFEENSFDAAICALGLMYFPFPVKGLQEMHRVLKPGGRAAVAIWGERKNCGWADIFPIVDKKVASDVCPMFFQQGTGNTLEKSFKTAGFGETEVIRFHHTLIFKNENHALMAAFSGGPVALAYRKFNDETKDQVHREYLYSISEFRSGEGYKIPGEFVVARGVKY